MARTREIGGLKSVWQMSECIKIFNRDFSALAAATKRNIEQTVKAFEILENRKLVEVSKNGTVSVAEKALRHTFDEMQRRIVCYLLGYKLTDNPWIVREPRILGGMPVIAGTRMPVQMIAVCYQLGKNVDAIQEDYPELTNWEIHAAIKYYLEHQTEIDREIEQGERDFNKHLRAQTSEQGRILLAVESENQCSKPLSEVPS